MPQVIKTIINQFDGGITNNPRNNRENVARMITNFDGLTDPFKLTPYRAAEDGDSAGNTSVKRNFAMGRRTGSTYSLYALGVQSGAGDAEVLYKDITTGGANDLDDAGWSTPSNNQQSAGTIPDFSTFTYYATQDQIYCLALNSSLYYYQSFYPTGSAWVNTSSASLGSELYSAAEGLVHSKDDIMYLPYNNKIAANNDGSWTETAFTIREGYKITCLAEFGNYLAIAAAPRSGVGNSVVYLWGRNTSLTTAAEIIDFGSGEIKVLANVNGELIGISQLGGLGSSAASTRLGSKVVFRRYAGGYPVARHIETFCSEDSQALVLSPYQVEDDRVYFMGAIKLNGATREGTWSYGRSKTTNSFTLLHERTVNGDDDGSSYTLRNFILVGEYLFQAYVDDGTHDVSKTTNTSTDFGDKSIYESAINPKVPRDLNYLTKQLKSVYCKFEPLPAAGQIDMYYRVDEGAWVQIFSETTDSAVIKEAVIDNNGDVFTPGREYEFKIESTGGGVITEWGAEYETLDSLA